MASAMEKYYKNFILCGDVDFYCLGCQELFQVLPEVDKHLRWEQHRKFLKSQAYLAKFKKDCIYKTYLLTVSNQGHLQHQRSYKRVAGLLGITDLDIGDYDLGMLDLALLHSSKQKNWLQVYNNFYCEICNYVVGDKDDIIPHIETDRHQDIKNNGRTETRHFIGIYDAGYVIINKVILNMPQWNSIINNKCHLCDTDVMDTENIRRHMILERHVINIIQSKTVYEPERYYRMVTKLLFYIWHS